MIQSPVPRPYYSRGGAWRGGDRRRERRGMPTSPGREARLLLLRLALAGGAAALDPGLPSPILPFQTAEEALDSLKRGVAKDEELDLMVAEVHPGNAEMGTLVLFHHILNELEVPLITMCAYDEAVSARLTLGTCFNVVKPLDTETVNFLRMRALHHRSIKNHRSETEDEEQDALNANVYSDNLGQFIWSSELHEKFLQAVEVLGASATARNIHQYMNAKDLNMTIQHVASHLQKQRLSHDEEGYQHYASMKELSEMISLAYKAASAKPNNHPATTYPASDDMQKDTTDDVHAAVTPQKDTMEKVHAAVTPQKDAMDEVHATATPHGVNEVPAAAMGAGDLMDLGSDGLLDGMDNYHPTAENAQSEPFSDWDWAEVEKFWTNLMEGQGQEQQGLALLDLLQVEGIAPDELLQEDEAWNQALQPANLANVVEDAHMAEEPAAGDAPAYDPANQSGVTDNVFWVWSPQFAGDDYGMPF